MTSRTRLTWPLTGRSQEMRLIEAALSEPDSSGIVICGAAGVGKSRIARDAIASASSRGVETRWAMATASARSLPLGALASWTGSAGGDTLQLVRGIIEALTSGPPGVTVAVGVDDVHLLDDLSTFVLHQIVQRRAAKVVLTIRDGEPVPAGLQEVWKGGQLDRVDLQPLSRDETAALLSATLRGPLDPDAARRLWTLTRGNALYLRNIVEREVADGRLAQQHGYWRWTGDATVPPSLAELIESRIGAFEVSVSEVVDALAVGEPIDLKALTRITDSAAIEEADARGLITVAHVDHGAEVRLAHPLYGEVRRARAPQTKLRRLRGLVAAELASSEDRDDMRVLVRRATLSTDSDLEPDPDLLTRAAQGAVWLADLPLADRLAEAAIRASAGAEANFVRAHALSWLSRGEEAEAVLAEMQIDDFTDAEKARRAFLRAHNLLFSRADPIGAKKFIDDASHTTPPEARCFIDAFLVVYWALTGKPDAARTSASELNVTQLPAIIGAGAAMANCVACGDAGRTAEATTAADAGYEIVRASFDAAHMRFVVADGHIGALLQSGRVGEAGDVAERLQQEATDLPGAAQLFSYALSGVAALGAGRLDATCALLAPVIETLSVADTIGWAYRYQLPWVVALAISGSRGDASEALRAAEKLRHPAWRYLDFQYALAHAWVTAAEGAVTEAIKIALSAAETACANGQFAAAVVCLQTATQFGDRSCAPRLRELEAMVEGPRVGLAVRFATALRAGDGAELAAVSTDFEQMGDVVAALDASAYAAVAYRRQDLRGSALGCSTRAEALAELCGGAQTPALRQASERLPLTDREREIVMLLAEGLSSREIAERLTVSTRTVEGHIYHAMTKTGVASREELAALMPAPRAQAQK
jgi:DNA-binding CsgD family transcriptional regulator